MDTDAPRTLMQVELRPFEARKAPGLDEIVADNVAVFHAEMMSYTSLWIGLSDNHDGLFHIHIGIERHEGRDVLVMYGYDQDRPTIVTELDRLKASRLTHASPAPGTEAEGQDAERLGAEHDGPVGEAEAP